MCCHVQGRKVWREQKKHWLNRNLKIRSFHWNLNVDIRVHFKVFGFFWDFAYLKLYIIFEKYWFHIKNVNSFIHKVISCWPGSTFRNKCFAVYVPDTFCKGFWMCQHTLADTHYQYAIKCYPTKSYETLQMSISCSLQNRLSLKLHCCLKSRSNHHLPSFWTIILKTVYLSYCHTYIYINDPCDL